MKTRGTGMVGYNVQSAVDTKHHLIIAHEVTNDGIDRSQLKSMAEQARNALGCKELSVVADRRYCVMNLLGIAALIRTPKAYRIFLRSIRFRFRLITTDLRGRLGTLIRRLRFLTSLPNAE